MAQKEGSKIKIRFRNADGGLSLEGDTVNALKVRSQGSFLDYKERIEGDTLILELEGEAPSGTAVELAKGDFYLVNLYNKAHIPAVPFSITLE